MTNVVKRLKKLSLNSLDHERLVAVFVRENGEVIALRTVAKGGKKDVDFSPLTLTDKCQQLGAVGFILAHNHPGQEKAGPSMTDRITTKNVAIWAKLKGFRLVDHYIIDRNNNPCSMKEQGYMKGEW